MLMGAGNVLMMYAKRKMGFIPTDDSVREHRAILITAIFGGIFIPVNLVTTLDKFSTFGQLFSPALGTFLYQLFLFLLICYYFN